jgi:hypothetical protein
MSNLTQINVLDPPPLSHPFHLHSRPFYIVARGPGALGTWTKWLAKINTKNPLRRDTITIPHWSWAIIRVPLDDPGVLPLHCHIGWHLSVGKMAVVVIGQDSMKQFTTPNADWQALCAGTDPNAIGPAKRGFMPPQGRARHIETDDTPTNINGTLWPGLGQPFVGELKQPFFHHEKKDQVVRRALCEE